MVAALVKISAAGHELWRDLAVVENPPGKR